MSPRAMRKYRPALIVCAKCARPILPRQEARMVGRDVYHVGCQPERKAPPEITRGL